MKRALLLVPVNTDGIPCHSLTLCTSSIDGKCCEDSVKWEDDVCGEEGGEDVGDCVSALRRGTNTCGEGMVDLHDKADKEGTRFNDADANVDPEDTVAFESRF